MQWLKIINVLRAEQSSTARFQASLRLSIGDKLAPLPGTRRIGMRRVARKIQRSRLREAYFSRRQLRTQRLGDR